MNNRAKELFNFRDELEKVLSWDWSDETKKELQSRLDLINSEIKKEEERQAEIYAQSEDSRRMNKRISDSMDADYKSRIFYTGR